MRPSAVPLPMPQGAGLIERVVTRVLMRAVRVSAVETPDAANAIFSNLVKPAILNSVD